MDRASATKLILYITNAMSFIFGLSIASASIWFFVQLHEFIRLRNMNHYLLDFTVYWPQAIPWIFFVVAVFVMSVSSYGFVSVNKNSRNAIVIYMIFLGILIVCLITSVVIALVLADNKSINDFIKDIAWDAFSRAKTNNDVADAFGMIERKLHCCGVGSPRDYKNWKNIFPMSCCDGHNYGWIEPYITDCDFTNKFANGRHGCADVAVQYAGIAVKVLSGASIFTTLIVVISFVAAVLRYSVL